MDENRRVQHLLNKYAATLDQLLNMKKMMYFSKIVTYETHQQIRRLWGALNSQHYEKYLGLPSRICKS